MRPEACPLWGQAKDFFSCSPFLPYDLTSSAGSAHHTGYRPGGFCGATAGSEFGNPGRGIAAFPHPGSPHAPALGHTHPDARYNADTPGYGNAHFADADPVADEHARSAEYGSGADEHPACSDQHGGSADKHPPGPDEHSPCPDRYPVVTRHHAHGAGAARYALTCRDGSAHGHPDPRRRGRYGAAGNPLSTAHPDGRGHSATAGSPYGYVCASRSGYGRFAAGFSSQCDRYPLCPGRGL
jgi:hypothetical protein